MFFIGVEIWSSAITRQFVQQPLASPGSAKKQKIINFRARFVTASYTLWELSQGSGAASLLCPGTVPWTGNNQTIFTCTRRYGPLRSGYLLRLFFCPFGKKKGPLYAVFTIFRHFFVLYSSSCNFSKHRPSGLMLSISRLSVRLSVRVSVCVSVHF